VDDFQIPIIAASSPIEISEHLNLLGAVITKSITRFSKEGDPSSFQVYDSNTHSLNAQGLPNLGIEQFVKLTLPRYQKCLTVPLILSVYVSNVYQLDFILKQIKPLENCLCGLEMNLSCPNVENEINLIEVVKYFHKNKPDLQLYSAKLSSNTTDDFIDFLLQHSFNWINCFNTLPASVIHSSFKGGIGGQILKHFYPKRIEQIKKIFPKVNIIGCGGIETGQDVKDYLNAGSNLVAVGSYFVESSKNIERIVTDYVSKFCF